MSSTSSSSSSESKTSFGGVQGQVIAILKAAANPMKAGDIVIELSKKYNTKAARSEVNKILYSGPFEKTGSDGAAPLWRLPADPEPTVAPEPTLWAPGFISLSLVSGTGTAGGEEMITAVIGVLSKLKFTEILCDASVEGKFAAQKAAEVGIAVVKTPCER